MINWSAHSDVQKMFSEGLRRLYVYNQIITTFGSQIHVINILQAIKYYVLNQCIRSLQKLYSNVTTELETPSTHPFSYPKLG